MEVIKGKTLININMLGKMEVMPDGKLYNTTQVGSIIIASDVKKNYGGTFEPRSGVVMTGEHQGKTAYIHKLCYKSALVKGQFGGLFKGNDIDMPDGDYLLIEDDNIYFYVNNGEVEMINGWTLCEAINNAEWEYLEGVRIKCRISTGGIVMPIMNEDYKTDKAILRHISAQNSSDLGLCAGQTVFIDRACDLPVEDELNQTLDKQYFRVHVDTILGIEE